MKYNKLLWTSLSFLYCVVIPVQLQATCIDISVQQSRIESCIDSTVILTGITSNTDPATQWGWKKGSTTGPFITGYELSSDPAKKTYTINPFSLADEDDYYFFVKNGTCEENDTIQLRGKQSFTIFGVNDTIVMSGYPFTKTFTKPIGSNIKSVGANDLDVFNSGGSTFITELNQPYFTFVSTPIYLSSTTTPGTMQRTLNTCTATDFTYTISVVNLEVEEANGGWTPKIFRDENTILEIDTTKTVKFNNQKLKFKWERKLESESNYSLLAETTSKLTEYIPTGVTDTYADYRATVTMLDPAGAPMPNGEATISKRIGIASFDMCADSIVNFCYGDIIKLRGCGEGLDSCCWSNGQWPDPPRVKYNGDTIMEVDTDPNLGPPQNWFFIGFRNGQRKDQSFTFIPNNNDITFNILQNYGCLGANNILTPTPTSTYSNVTYQWFIDGVEVIGLNSDTLKADQYLTTPGNYSIELIISGPGYCTSKESPQSYDLLDIKTKTNWPADACLNDSVLLEIDTTGTYIGNSSLVVDWLTKLSYENNWTSLPLHANKLSIKEKVTEDRMYYAKLKTPVACEIDLPAHTVRVIETTANTDSVKYTICKGNGVTLSGGPVTDADYWRWTDTTGLVLKGNSSSVADQKFQVWPGSDSVFLLVSAKSKVSGGECLVKQPHKVSVLPPVQFSLDKGNTTVCKGTPVAVTASSPTSGITYAWQVKDSNGGVIQQHNGSTINLPTNNADVMKVIVTATSSVCSTNDTITLTVVDLDLKLNGPSVFCDGNPVNLNIDTKGKPYTGVTWYIGDSLATNEQNQATVTFNVNKTKEYKVEVTNGYCTLRDSIVVNKALIAVQLSADTAIVCPGDPVVITADTTGTGNIVNRFNLNWQKQPASSSAIGNELVIDDNPLVQTRYIITANNSGCQQSDTITVNVFPAPVIESILEPAPKTVQINIVPGTGTPQFQYAIDDTIMYYLNNMFEDLEIGQHTAYVIDANQCKTDSIFVLGEIPLKFPPFFTPNGDGINDTWKVTNLEFFMEIDLRIYDRFGKELIHITDPMGEWDGIYRGRLMPSTDYWYVLNIKDTRKQYAGHFTLINR